MTDRELWVTVFAASMYVMTRSQAKELADFALEHAPSEEDGDVLAVGTIADFGPWCNAGKAD